jgi:hypothetical protein
MDIERRLAELERKLRRTRLALHLLCVCLLIGGAAAADPLLGRLLCRSLSVNDNNGKTVIELKESGEVNASGALRIKGTDILAATSALETRLTSLRGDISDLAKHRYGILVQRIVIYHKDDPGNGAIPANHGMQKLALKLPDGARVIEAWYTIERGQSLWKHFDNLDVGRLDDRSVGVNPQSPQEWPGGNVGLKVYVLYGVE